MTEPGIEKSGMFPGIYTTTVYVCTAVPILQEEYSILNPGSLLGILMHDATTIQIGMYGRKCASWGSYP